MSSITALRLLTMVMQCLSLRNLLCIHKRFAGHIPCGRLSADLVVLQTDAGVTLLKQGQHLPCGALVSSYQLGTKWKRNDCVCVCNRSREYIVGKPCRHDCVAISAQTTLLLHTQYLQISNVTVHLIYYKFLNGRTIFACPSWMSASWCYGTVTFCWQGRKKKA